MALFAALFREQAYLRVYEQAATNNVYAEAALSCHELAVAAFRCSDLHGFRDPSCLYRRTLHARCVADFVAPEFLARLQHCETAGETSCKLFEEDVVQVAAQRMAHHAASLAFSGAEEGAVRACGLPREARSRSELELRLQCLAPRLCPELFARAAACAAEGQSLTAPPCAEAAVRLAQCMGEEHARLLFH